MAEEPTENKRRSFWMSDELWDKIAKAAAEEERTISSWIRRACEAALKPARPRR